MLNLGEVLKTNALESCKYTKKNSVYILDTDKGRFIVKENKNKDLSKIYEYLDSRSFNNYLPSSYETDSYRLIPYKEDFFNPFEQKILELTKTISNLHQKTAHFKEVDLDLIKKIYEELNIKIEELKKHYLELIEYIESVVYPSPSEYLLCRNINKITASLEYCLNQTDAWYKSVSSKGRIRYTLCHMKPSLDHFIDGKEKYLISFEDAKFNLVIFDLLYIYKEHWHKIYFLDLLKIYEEKIKLTYDEKLLLSIYIALVDSFNFEFSEFENCQNITYLIDYIYKSEEIVMSLNENEITNQNYDGDK